jgi:hypothetical protein
VFIGQTFRHTILAASPGRQPAQQAEAAAVQLDARENRWRFKPPEFYAGFPRLTPTGSNNPVARHGKGGHLPPIRCWRSCAAVKTLAG